MYAILTCTFIPLAKATIPKDSLQNKLDTYLSENPYFKLYLHLDRNNYSPEDTIWFKAYSLSNLENKVLFVRLADCNKNIVLEKKFIMYDIRSNGEIQIPDTLREGKYYLCAYTDQMISANDMHVFVQPVSISKNIQNRLDAQACLINKNALHVGDKVEILVKVNNAFDRNLKGTYQLMNGTSILKKGRITTNKMGESNIRFNYPDLASYETLRCEIQLKDGKDIAEMKLNLRHDNPKIITTIYPESGRLLAGVQNNLLLEANDEAGMPVSCLLRIKEGAKTIAEATTDNNGIGNLFFKPQPGKNYKLESVFYDSVQIVDFPCPIEQQGYTMRLIKSESGNAAVIYNQGFPDSIQLVLRTTDNILWTSSYSVAGGDSLVVPLPLENMPGYTCSLALLDLNGNPFSERLFVNQNGSRDTVNIEVKHALKDGVNQVSASIKIMDTLKNPRITNISVSVVEKNSLDLKTFRNLPQTIQLAGLNNLPASLGEWNDRTSGELMLMNNPGRYAWNNIANFKSKGFVRFLSNAGGINGKIVSRYNTRIKLRELTVQTLSTSDKDKVSSTLKSLQRSVNPTASGVFNLNKISYSVIEKICTVPVDEDGTFHIQPEKLLVENNQENIIQLGPYFSYDYNIQVNDYCSEYDEILRLSKNLVYPETYNTVTQYEPPVRRNMNQGIQLKEVVVDGSGREEYQRTLGRKEDYVCREYNVFNCVNHRTGYKPVRGCVYSSGEKGYPFLYHGPGRYFTPAPEGSAPGYRIYQPISCITKPAAFFLPRAEDRNYLLTDARSTIFWAPNLFTDATGSCKFDFYTSGRKADFIIVVQGIDIKTNQPVFGTATFSL